MRDHDLLNLYHPNSINDESDTRMDLDKAIDYILFAVDRRARKVIFNYIL